MLKEPQVYVVGPILWTPIPPIKAKPKEDSKATVTIFDLTPVKDIVGFNKIQGRYCYRYGVEETCVKFLDDIFDSIHEVSKENKKCIHVNLKPKKDLSLPIISQDYLDVIEDSKENFKLDILDIDSDLFEVIDNSDLIIVMPFSSPAHVSAERGIPTAFYDPVDLLDEKTTFEVKGCEFIQNKEKLKSFLREKL